LNAGKAGFAFVECFDGRSGVAIMGGLMFINIETTTWFDTVAASGAVLPPVNASKLANPVKLSRSRNGINMISIRHF
jgi:hypothetical protein